MAVFDQGILTKMQKCYKILTENSYFRKIYDTDNLARIPFGTKVIASAPFQEDYTGKINGHWYIDKPVIHFCDNAFDTMLWHGVLCGAPANRSWIYEIKPLTAVFKEKCKDDIGLYQCGANIIEFHSLIPLDTMFDRAIEEFHQDHHAKIDMYPFLKISKIISAWVHHNQSKYIY